MSEVFLDLVISAIGGFLGPWFEKRAFLNQNAARVIDMRHPSRAFQRELMV